MHISLKPEIERYVEEQVKAGRYKSADEVLEDAVARMIHEDVEGLDEKTLDAINRAEDQIDRGEFHDWKEVSAQLRSKYTGK